MADNQETAPVTRSTAELLAQAEARVAKLKARLAYEQVLSGIEAGNIVTFRFGRNLPERVNVKGETVPARAARILTGEVTGFRDDLDDAGNLKTRTLKVRAGEGFDEDTYTINARDVLSIGGNDIEAPEGDDEASEAEAPAEVADEVSDEVSDDFLNEAE